MDGILIVNKPCGMTSHDVIYKVRKIYKTKQVGHTGTLDPMATGVLVVLIGRAVKASEYLVTHDKCYKAGLKLGITTDTEDTSGNILFSLPEDRALPSQKEVFDAAASFVGNINQIPPMYSALKVGGRKLADLARKGISVEREPRPVSVFSIGISSVLEASGDYLLDVHCSKGTYIRTLCADIGSKLGCGGAMSSLVRTESGGFSLSESYTLDKLYEMDEDQLASCLIPTERLFSSCPVLRLSDYPAFLSKNGAELYLDRRNEADLVRSGLSLSLPLGLRLRLYDKDGFFGIGDVMDFEDGRAIKAIKLFRLDQNGSTIK